MRKIILILIILIINIQLLANTQDHTNSISNTPVSTRYKFKRLIIADTEEKVINLKFPAAAGNILIMDVPALNSKEFSSLIDPFYGRSLNAELINQLSAVITQFLTSKGLKRITVLLPEQNIQSPDLRLTVVIGKFSLAQIYIYNLTDPNTTFTPNNSGQIFLKSTPAYLSTPEFVPVLAPHFSKPITSESVNKIVTDLSSFVSRKGGYLAGVQVPEQNVETGLLKIGIVVGKYPLKQIVITNTPEESAFTKTNYNSSSVIVINNSVYSTAEFNKYISKYFGKPITVELILSLRKDLVVYGQTHNRVISETTPPYIDLDKGQIRVAALIGRYNKVHLKGNRWFSDDLLVKKLGIKVGDEIKPEELDNALSWANQNPFRQVQVQLDTMNNAPGRADLDIAVNEYLPVRSSISYSNAINSPIGNSSYSASSQFGNLWGLDHEMTFQYSTNNTPKYDQSYSFSYKAPLFWHDFIRTDIAYSLVYPQSIGGYVGLNEKAKNSIVDIRYIKPITRGAWSFEYSVGLDYKQIATNILFGSLTNPVSVYDVAQLVAGSTAVHKDLKGSWTVGINADFSPGGINNRNNDLAYSKLGTTGRSVRYTYGKVILERYTNLPWQMVWVSRAQIQMASTNLQGSEQLLLGGGATVRGYAQSYSGDQGWILNQELRTKYFTTNIPFMNKKKTQLNTQLVSFLDYGDVSYKHVNVSDVTLPRLMGSGVGIRSSIYGHFSMGSDMSWPIFKPTYLDSHPAKGTFWASLAY